MSEETQITPTKIITLTLPEEDLPAEFLVFGKDGKPAQVKEDCVSDILQYCKTESYGTYKREENWTATFKFGEFFYTFDFSTQYEHGVVHVDSDLSGPYRVQTKVEVIQTQALVRA